MDSASSGLWNSTDNSPCYQNLYTSAINHSSSIPSFAPSWSIYVKDGNVSERSPNLTLTPFLPVYKYWTFPSFAFPFLTPVSQVLSFLPHSSSIPYSRHKHNQFHSKTPSCRPPTNPSRSSSLSTIASKRSTVSTIPQAETSLQQY